MGKIIHLIDRSRVVAREDCPRMRFLGYDFEGDGLDSEAASLPLLSGIAIHAAHARLLAGQPLEGVVESIISDYVAEINTRGLYGLEVTKGIIKEQAALLEGMLRLWAATRMPLILEEYAVESIEQKWDWEMAPGLVERIRMDAILIRKDDGLRHILDYKSMGYASEFFMEKAEHDLQTNLYIQALKERTQEPVGGIVYEGLIKGQFRKDTAKSSPFYGTKIQQSPYTLTYALKGDAGTLYETEYTSRKGWEKVHTFDEMSMKEWVEHYLIPGGKGITQSNELFVAVPAILPSPAELLRTKRQVVNEELEYLDQLERYRNNQQFVTGSSVLEAKQEEFLDNFAPIRTGRCFKFGPENGCKFRSICFNQGAQPLSDGGFKKRIPHHDVDLTMVA